MFRNYASAGDEVPSIGTYWVHHYCHRFPHLATLQVTRFPKCQHCGEMVKFEKVELAKQECPPVLRFDADFSESCRGIRLHQSAYKARS